MKKFSDLLNFQKIMIEDDLLLDIFFGHDKTFLKLKFGHGPICPSLKIHLFNLYGF